MGATDVLDEVKKLLSDENGSSRTKRVYKVVSKTPKVDTAAVKAVIRKMVSGVDVQISNMNFIREGLLTLEAILTEDEGGSDGKIVSEEGEHRGCEAPGSDSDGSEPNPDGGSVGSVLPSVP